MNLAIGKINNYYSMSCKNRANISTPHKVATL